MNLTKEQRIAKHKDFLNANWRSLAAFAWEHFLIDGVGMVVVPEEDFVQADQPQYALLRFRYVSNQSPEFSNLPDWGGSKEEGWLKSYDPKQKVIVMIVRQGGGTSSYLIGGKPPPPDCYAVKKSEEN